MAAPTRWLTSLSLGLILVVGAVVAPAAIAADGVVRFDRPSAASTFPVQTEWRQEFRSATAPERVELMTRLEGTETWLVQEVPFAAVATGAYEVDYLDLGFQLPNSRLEYRFRVTPKGGAPVTGPQATHAVVDDRIDWRTIEGDLVRLHWQAGDAAFADRALRIAEDSIKETSALLGVAEREPIDFFIYADADDFQSALGPGTKEFVAGRAIAEIRTLFAEIDPNEIGSPWLSIVVPHELTHLVFDTATRNPYHQPPHWLNEGLAVYLSEGFSDRDRQRVSNAIERGTLLPLAALTDGFPSAREELFYLGYAEGTSAVDFFIRAYGQDKLVELIRSYATGVTDDHAFTSATGEDVDAFESAWLVDIGAQPPEVRGPQEARAGRTPAAWGGPGGSDSTPEPAGMPLAARVGLVIAGLSFGLLVIAAVVIRRRRVREAVIPSSIPVPDEE
jgi:peptidase MA superfamily protein